MNGILAMKKNRVKKLGLAGLFCALILPVPGFTDSVTTDVKSYLDEKKPENISEYPPVFEHVHDQHAPVIKESTLVTVLFYFTEADEPKVDDIITLTRQAVTSAIAKANAELAASRAAGEEGEDRRGFYITDAVCGAFSGALSSAYKQTTAAWKSVEGGMLAALAAGADPSFAATVVSRGIDTCLDEKLDYEVWMYVQQGINAGLAGTGVAYSYLAPTGAYLLPPGLDGEIFPEVICVENCVDNPPVPPLPPGPSPSPSQTPASNRL